MLQTATRLKDNWDDRRTDRRTDLLYLPQRSAL